MYQDRKKWSNPPTIKENFTRNDRWPDMPGALFLVADDCKNNQAGWHPHYLGLMPCLENRGHLYHVKYYYLFTMVSLKIMW